MVCDDRYTGYIPSSGAVVLPIKGAEHTGRPVGDEVLVASIKKTVDPKKTSE